VLTIHDELGQVRGPRSSLFEALETQGDVQESDHTMMNEKSPYS